MKRRSDEEISAPLYAFDAEVRSQYGWVAGASVRFEPFQSGILLHTKFS